MTFMSIVDEIKERTDILQVIERHVKLKKSGKTYIGLCPFHTEKTASFVVWPDTGTWRCFGSCNTGGDMFSFVMKHEGWDFAEALRELARQANVELKPMSAEEKAKAQAERSKQDQLDAMRQWAADFYKAQLLDNNAKSKNAMEYLAGRGFKINQVKMLCYGYSQSDDALLKAMTAEHPAWVPLAREIGLIRKDGKDFTANAEGDTNAPNGWLVFAHTLGSHVADLSTRAVGDVHACGKTRNLPGSSSAYHATQPLRTDKNELIHIEDNALIVTEGVIDADTNRCHWYHTAYAMNGPTPSNDDDPRLEYLRKAKRRGVTLYFGMSNDANGAGESYARKLAEKIDPLARILYWPIKRKATKSDANSWFTDTHATPRDMEELLAKSKTYLDIIIDEARHLDGQDKSTAIERLAMLVAQIDNTSRKLYIKTISAKLKVQQAYFEKLVCDCIPKERDSGVSVMGGELCLWGQAMLNGTVRIEKQMSLDDGSHAPTIAYSVIGKRADGKPLRTIDKMPAEEFESHKWLGRYWGADMYPYVGSGKYHMVKQAILKFGEKDMQRDTVYTFTGWHTINGQRVFLTSSGALNSRLDQSARVDLDNNLAHYYLSDPPTGEELVESIAAWLELLDVAPPTVTVPLFCAMHAAPFTPVKSLNTIIDIYGPTQSRKSTLAHLFLSAYGAGFIAGREFKSPQNWISSFSDIEGTMFTAKDIPLIIDDYTPQVEPDQIKKAAMVIRALGNRAGRGRRNADMTAREKFNPRCLAIMTAEQPLNDEGIVGRILYINVPRDSIDRDSLTVAQGKHHLYSMMMAGFISHLSEHWERATEEFKNLLGESLIEVRGVFPNHERLCDYFSILHASSVIAMRWMRSSGAISSERMETLITLNKIALLEVLEKQEQNLKRQSPVCKFFRALDELLTQGRVVFAPKGNHEFAQPYNTVLIGWRGENKQPNHSEFSLPAKGTAWVWLLVSPALREVKNYQAGLDEPMNTLKDALVRELQQGGYVARRDGHNIGMKLSKSYDGYDDRVMVLDAVKVMRDFGINLLGMDDNKWIELLEQLGYKKSQISDILQSPIGGNEP
jgi:DNA primase catalytic core